MSIGGGLSGAAGGAAIGSLFGPPWGTAIGAGAGFLGGLFGGSRKGNTPQPAGIPPGFVPESLINPGADQSYFIDLNTGQKIRWSGKGGRWKPTGQLDPGELARLQSIVSERQGGGGAGGLGSASGFGAGPGGFGGMNPMLRQLLTAAGFNVPAEKDAQGNPIAGTETQAPWALPPEQRALIEQMFGEQLNLGKSDLEAQRERGLAGVQTGETRGLEALNRYGVESAGARGLRLTDTPIAGDVAQRVGQLTSDVATQRSDLEKAYGRQLAGLESGVRTGQAGAILQAQQGGAAADWQKRAQAMAILANLFGSNQRSLLGQQQLQQNALGLYQPSPFMSTDWGDILNKSGALANTLGGIFGKGGGGSGFGQLGDWLKGLFGGSGGGYGVGDIGQEFGF